MELKPPTILGELVSFEKRPAYDDCKHRRTIIDSKLLEIECKDCGAKLNPVQWLIDWLPHINQQLKNNREKHAKALVIWEKLEQKSRFACKKCHEVNTIEFGKLAIKAAVERKMQLLEQEIE